MKRKFRYLDFTWMYDPQCVDSVDGRWDHRCGRDLRGSCLAGGGMRNKQAACVLLMLLFVGCDDKSTPKVVVVPAHGTRFTVHEVGVFDDSDAYKYKRKIFILTDTETDKQYVGITGIGISEVGDHQTADDPPTTEQDER